MGTAPCPPEAESALLCAWPFCIRRLITKEYMGDVAAFSPYKGKLSILRQCKALITQQG